uniref:Uncharacterized protein n=1 Tax=Rhizophora mucronata TaxID=61149 RepID=A0A2P2M394_RHIMU
MLSFKHCFLLSYQHDHLFFWIWNVVSLVFSVFSFQMFSLYTGRCFSPLLLVYKCTTFNII